MRVLFGLPHRRGEAPERRRHPIDRGVDGRRFAQIDPRDAEMRRVRKSLVRDLAALERARELRIGHVITIP